MSEKGPVGIVQEKRDEAQKPTNQSTDETWDPTTWHLEGPH
jgi:hypothetical protein